MTATVNPEADQPDPSPDHESSEINDYVAAVRSHLTDLDADEIDELTDDLRSHLTEVRADTDRPFDEVIGTPEQFATELRLSAGLSQTPASKSALGGVAQRFGASMQPLRRWFDRMASHPWAQAVVSFGPELRPAWWVARGFLLASALAAITGGQMITNVIVPSVFGSAVLGLLVTVGFVIGSVRFGRARIDATWARWASVAAALVAALAAIGIVDRASSAYTLNGGYVVDYNDPGSAGLDGPLLQDGLPANIYAVLPDGTVLDQVLLYDESGSPLNLASSGYSMMLDSEFEAELTLDDLGHPIDNLYPRRLFGPEWGDDGQFQYSELPPPIIEREVPLTTEIEPESTTTTEATNNDTPTSDTPVEDSGS